MLAENEDEAGGWLVLMAESSGGRRDGGNGRRGAAFHACRAAACGSAGLWLMLAA